ncbi:transposase [Nocardia sp. NPDC059246]|uniref:transposase n=1 Tax=unclassified Nocardia TaxID=2637762 RepID=UPI00369086FC
MLVDDEQGSLLRPKRTHIVGLYTQPPEGATVVCADELGPVSARTFGPAPGWSVDGHRIKAPLEYSRGPDRVWVYGSIRVRDGHAVTLTASSRNSINYQPFLELVEQANPVGDIYVITDNLSSHNSKSTREWLEDYPRIKHAFIPVGACWLNLQEPWWRIFRREALAGQTFADEQRRPTRRNRGRNLGHCRRCFRSTGQPAWALSLTGVETRFGADRRIQLGERILARRP